MLFNTQQPIDDLRQIAYLCGCQVFFLQTEGEVVESVFIQTVKDFEEKIQALRAQNPSLFDAYIATFVKLSSNAGRDEPAIVSHANPKNKVKKYSGASVRERVIECISEEGPQTMKELMEKLQTSRGNISNVLYTMNAKTGEFEKVSDVEPYRWRLKNS
jgi:DNA-binding CsgD family transcriptional regulator